MVSMTGVGFFYNLGKNMRGLLALVLGLSALVACNQPTPPPSTPGSLSATPNATPAVVLSWGASERATSYELERKTGSSGTYALIATPNGDTTTFTDTSVAFSTTYSYRIRAVGVGGKSDWLERANVATLAQPTQPPGAPQNLSATATSPTSITLTWQAPTSGGAVASYRIQRKEGASGSFSNLATVFTPNFSDNSASPSTTYTYQVRAENSAGNSPYTVSSPVTTPSGSPSAPGNPQNVLAWATSPTAVRVEWQAPASGGAVSSYVLERRLADGSYSMVASNIQNLFYLDSTVSNPLTYTYRVRAVNGTGTSAGTESNPVPVPAPCNAPQQVNQRGCFGPVRPNWPLVPTYAALLPTGKVIAWYASDDVGKYRERTDVHNVSPRSNSTLGDEDGSLVTLWDPARDAFEDASFGNRSSLGVSEQPKGTDLFCAGYTVLTDGRLFTAGGNTGLEWGSIRLNIFDPVAKQWENGPGPATPNMWRDRWYPTVTKLPNGELLITGGTAQRQDSYRDSASNAANGNIETAAGDPSRTGQNLCRTPSGTCPNGLEHGVPNPASPPNTATAGIRGIREANGTMRAGNIGYNNAFEVYNPTNGSLRMLNSNASAVNSFEHYYPWWHVVPDGRVLLAGASQDTAILNVNTDDFGGLLRRDGQRVYGSSVMFRPGSVLVVGGGYAFRDGSGNVQLGQSGLANTTFVLTVPLNASSATVSAGPNMTYRRTHADTVLLPDGRVFVHGGQQSGGENGTLDTSQWANTVNPDTLWNLDLAVRTSEIWTPPSGSSGTGSFALGARSQEERIYHSTAMLLPDGTVLTAGGGGCGTCDQLEPAVYGSLSGLSGAARGERINKKNHEIYYPPYLFKSDGSLAPRPIIQSTSLSPTGNPPYPTVAYDSEFTLTWAHPESGRSIQKVSLIALGAPTHGFDQNQRYLEPEFTASGNVLTIRTDFRTLAKFGGANQSRNAAPPGFYMLFILDDQGVPSVASIIRIQ